MSTSPPVPEPPEPSAPACTYLDPSGIDRDDHGLVEPALWHMAHAAAYGCGAMARNSGYGAGVAVVALTQTVAAATIIAGHLDGYLGDVWPDATHLVARAHRLLGEARALLDEAHHHCTLTPSALEDDRALTRVLAHLTTADPANDHAPTGLHETDSLPADPMLATV